MDREELILERNCEQEEAAQHFVDGLTCQTSLRSAFKKGARWSDAHPRKGLVDIDAVCQFLSDRITDITYLNEDNTNEHYDKDEFIEELRNTLLKELTHE